MFNGLNSNIQLTSHYTCWKQAYICCWYCWNEWASGTCYSNFNPALWYIISHFISEKDLKDPEKDVEKSKYIHKCMNQTLTFQRFTWVWTVGRKTFFIFIAGSSLSFTSYCTGKSICQKKLIWSSRNVWFCPRVPWAPSWKQVVSDPS